MRKLCERKCRARRLLYVAIGMGAAALVFYCVPWWVFLLIGVVSLLAAGFLLLRQ
jgi:hypothetical protein